MKKDYNYKFMNETHVAEIEELWKDHGEALAAFSLECCNSWNEGWYEGFTRGVIKQTLLTTAGIGVIAGGIYLGKKVYHKLKEEKKPTEKPGRVWEA